MIEKEECKNILYGALKSIKLSVDQELDHPIIIAYSESIINVLYQEFIKSYELLNAIDTFIEKVFKEKKKIEEKK